MNLFLHIGTEKTGSSFIQTVFANNRSLLESNSIFFPSAGIREKGMKSGLISPGNGKDLFLALKNKDSNSVVSLLSFYKNSAEGKGCSKILLSNENLLEVLSDSSIVELLKKSCLEVSVTLSTMLLIIRNPVEQAMSLYKHRAKSGAEGDVKEWLSKDYKLPGFLDGIVEQSNTGSLEIRSFLYNKNSDYLIDVFFKQWLGVEDLPLWNVSIVNPSLTFSELLILSELRKIKPLYVPLLYKCFLSVPLNAKNEDKINKENVFNYLNNQLVEYDQIWSSVHKMLIEDKDFIYPKSNNIKVQLESNLSLSISQINCYSEFLNDTKTIKFKIAFFKNRFKYFISSLKKIFTK